ncbi:hypothetical protein N0V83_002925 [Neocucurbitaria cava]|uniref:Uncharacterized protein n=1 Tax=Neocucurbitaria cava TaxID=798079 RepID=A0A9W8YD08_9PLEO|nr:hypothetical protein N0V83_002925 [Neocucurbitaria cava]
MELPPATSDRGVPRKDKPKVTIVDLPVELIGEIAGHLVGDIKALSTLSTFSREIWLQKAVDSHLYKTLDFDDRKEISMKKLLLALLGRKELVKHIKVIRLRSKLRLSLTSAPEDLDDHEDFEDSEHQTELEKKMRERSQAIRDRFNDLTRHVHKISKYDGARWETELISHVDSFDATAALIFHMATNIQYVDLAAEESLELTKYALNVPDVSRDGTGGHPFERLKEVTIGGYSRIYTALAIRPSMTTVTLYSADSSCGVFRPLEPFKYPAPADRSISLHTLIFSGFTNVTPQYVESMLSSRWLANLKKLVISRCGRKERQSDDLTNLVKALKQHVPDLQVLEYRRNPINRRSHVFDTFETLEELRELGVDYSSLKHNGDNLFESLSNFSDKFPKTLEAFTLDSIPFGQLDDLLFKFRKDGGKLWTSSTVSRSLKDLASDFPFKRLTLCIQCGADEEERKTPKPEHINFLRDAANELAEIGRTLEVYRMPWSIDSFDYELLIKPASPMPDFANLAI